MKSRKAFVISFFKTVLLIAVLVSIVFFGVKYYKQLTEKPADAYDFLPEHPLIILQINNQKDFSGFITNNSFLSDFSNLLNINNIKKKILFADSLMSGDEELKNMWYSGLSLASVHFSGPEKFETIFIKSINNSKIQNKLHNIIIEIADSVEIIKSSTKENVIKLHQHSVFSNSYVSINRGVLLYSNSLSLINKSLEISKGENTIHKDTAFQQIYSTSGINAMANVFLNYRFLNRFLLTKIQEEGFKKINFIDNLALWGTYDIFARDDRIIFNGYTTTNKENSDYLEIFNNINPQKFTMSSILPFNTIGFIWHGFENYIAVRANYAKYLKTKHQEQEFNDRLKSLKKITGYENIDELIFPYIDNEFAVFYTNSHSGEKDIETYIVLKTKNTDNLKKNIINISKSTAEKTRNIFELISYRDNEIIIIEQDYFLFNLFGSFFKPLKNSYMTFIDDYWITANSQEAIESYINSIIAGRTLSQNKFYNNFSETVGDESNIYIFTSPRNHINNLIKYFNQDIQSLINTNIDEFINFDGFGILFSNNNDMFFSTVSFYRTTEQVDEKLSGWQITLEAPISFGPFFAPVHTATEKNIIVFDAFNNMYFISNKGDVLWKKPLPEKPVSSIYAVDAYKNNKIQYIFNSENYLFLIDRLGNDVPNYPLKLPQKASSSISVFDYENNKDYRIVFAGINNKIYNYTIESVPIKGWEEPIVKNTIKEPVQYIRFLNHDFVIAKDIDNRAYFFNRRGQIKLEFPENVKLGEYSSVYAAANYCKCFISSTNEGQIFKLYLDGETQTTTLQEFSKGHVFLYKNFKPDLSAQNNFIFIDNGKIFIYDISEKLQNTIEITEHVGRKNFFIDKSPHGPLLAIYSADGKMLYIVNENINTKNYSFPTDNNADWTYDEKNNILYIVTSIKNILYFNVVEK